MTCRRPATRLWKPIVFSNAIRLVLCTLGCLLFTAVGTIAVTSSGGHSTSAMVDFEAPDQLEDITYWEEEIPPDEAAANDDTHSPGSRRQWIWNGRLDDEASVDEYGGAASRGSTRRKDRSAKPHPLRTDLWQLTVSASSRDAMRLLGTTKQNDTLVMEFSENGFVRLERSTLPPVIGKWEQRPSGLAWHVPVHGTEVDAPSGDHGVKTVLHYHADLILNPFGSFPRMVRGTVTRDRYATNRWLPNHWFRPVAATFTGRGIGKDTADTSYHQRRFGVSSPPKSDATKL